MKRCTNCKIALADGVSPCPRCGCTTSEESSDLPVNRKNGLKIAIKVFMIIALLSTFLCIFLYSIFYIVLLFVQVPMVLVYFAKSAENEKIGLAFKICSLLFISILVGILLFFDNPKPEET